MKSSKFLHIWLQLEWNDQRMAYNLYPLMLHHDPKAVFFIAAQIAQVAWPIWIALDNLCSNKEIQPTRNILRHQALQIMVISKQFLQMQNAQHSYFHSLQNISLPKISHLTHFTFLHFIGNINCYDNNILWNACPKHLIHCSYFHTCTSINECMQSKRDICGNTMRNWPFSNPPYQTPYSYFTPLQSIK